MLKIEFAIADKDLVRGEAIATKIRNGGGEAFFHEVNIVLDKKVKSAIERVVAEYGSLDIAFNNASVESDNAFFVTGHILPIDGGLKALSVQ